MDTLDQPKIKTLSPVSRKQNVIKNCCGFTLIELLVVISTVAILIGLLLPVIQKKREEYAANKATQNLMAMLTGSNTYMGSVGFYPRTIADLVQFCGANHGSCSLDPQLASGRMGGYVFMLNGTGVGGTGEYQIEAEPEYPGITGSVTLTINQNGTLISTPTPNSDAARQQAFDNILASGAKTVVDLLALDSNATPQIRAYTGATTIDAGTLNSVFTTLDTSRDGKVSVEEITASLTSDPLGPTHLPEKAFLNTVSRELRLDTLSEQELQDITVSLGDLNGDGNVDGSDYLLFSYEGLRNLTRTLAPDFNNDLIAKLDAAEVAEASGNLNRKAKSLKQYRKLVKAQIGTSLTRANANILLTLSYCLV